MSLNRLLSSDVDTLKWLLVPRTTCSVMIAYSTRMTATTMVERVCARCLRVRSSETSQAQLSA